MFNKLIFYHKDTQRYKMSLCAIESKADAHVSDTKSTDKYQELDLACKELETKIKLYLCSDIDFTQANTDLEEIVLPELIEAVKRGEGIIIRIYPKASLEPVIINGNNVYWKQVNVSRTTWKYFNKTRFAKELNGKFKLQLCCEDTLLCISPLSIV